MLQDSEASPEQSVPPLLVAGLVQERVRVPPPQFLLQVDHVVQPPLTAGHAAGLHPCELSPEQSLPPFAGAGSVQLRVSVPPPHSALQSPQLDQPPLTGVEQLAALHDCWASPPHVAPPLAGAGFVQVRVWVPPPHVTLH